MSAEQIQPGTDVVVTDAHGRQHRVRAISWVEPRRRARKGRPGRPGRLGHDFPVVWVEFDDGGRLPWPAEHVSVRDTEDDG